MATKRHQFSRLGFIMAAAGSAVGLGNIWSFPTQVAQNGGAAFLFVYAFFTLFLVLPALLAEITIGYYTRANPVGAFKKIHKKLGVLGYLGMLCTGLVLIFYAIIGGRMVEHGVRAGWQIITMFDVKNLFNIPLAGDRFFTTCFYGATLFIILGGLKKGIEYWSKILMPSLVILLVGLISYMITLPGAIEGLKNYLIPDFDKIWDTKLILNAMTQAFFTASLGAGPMLVYGSYLNTHQRLDAAAASVLAFDFIVAFLAGLLIIPAMYVASQQGVKIFNQDGGLIERSRLVFQVLPALFQQMGVAGSFVMLAFFLLMTLASITTSISIIEVFVSYFEDKKLLSRKSATWLTGIVLWSGSMVILQYEEILFGWAVKISVGCLLPALNVACCLVLGWGLKKEKLMSILQGGGVHNVCLIKTFIFLIRYLIPVLVSLIWWRGLCAASS